MWIIPKSLASSFAPDTAAFVSDLNEQSRLCASSLLVRSKPSPLRTWLLKWKRDSWTLHLSGRILKPSHTERFTDWLTSSLRAIHASRSAPPASAKAQTIHATCGRSSQLELPLCGPSIAFLKTSKDTSASDSAKSLENWKAWVIALRQAYSARLNAARLTSGKECSSWPTAQTADGGKIGNQANYGQVCLSNHPAIVGLPTRAPLGKSGRPAPESHSTAGSRRERAGAMWPQVRATDHKDGRRGNDPRHGRMLPEEVRRSMETDQWRTPSVSMLNADRAKDGAAYADKRMENGNTISLTDHVQLIERKAWSTPKASDPQHAGPNMRDSAGNLPLPSQVHKESESWPTPHSSCATGAGTQGRAGGKNIQTAVAAWSTPQCHDVTGRSKEQKEIHGAKHGCRCLVRDVETWRTPSAQECNGGQASEQEMAEAGRTVKLRYQVEGAKIGKPSTAKLNPRWVETLMGLPVGWVMPSCACPATIAPTSCAYLETELCQR